MADIFLAVFVVWKLYSDYCMFCFLKSDTAVALRRSVSIFPCLTIVFSSTFIISISVKWCGSLQYHRMFLELLNITRHCKLRFFFSLSNKTYMYCVTWSPMSVIWWRSSKVSDEFDLYFCFLWLLFLAGKMAVFFCDMVVT